MLRGAGLGVAIAGLTSAALAEVVTDGTLGPRARLNGPEFAAGAGLGRQAGRNLFHSFEKFSLAAGERATFSGPDAIRNVISRVTGGARSDIDGTIRSTIPGADFYLLNPAGVMFGPNARLDLKGSFHVSTADELRFTDGGRFSATALTASSFTVAAPEAFGFLGPSPASILVDRSVLEAPTGRSLSMVGGDIAIAGDPDAEHSGGPGTVRAEAGRITLVAVGGSGEARLGNGAIDAVRNADILLTDRALVDVSGHGGGTIHLGGGNVVLDNRSNVLASNSGASDAIGGINVRAYLVRITGGSALAADVLGAGNSGSLRLRADQIVLRDFSVISSDTFSSGNAASIVAEAREYASVLGGSRISSSANGEGMGGAIILKANNINIDGIAIKDGYFASSITTEALATLADDGRLIQPGDAGSITVAAANQLRLHNGGIITSAASGNANAGALTIQAAKVFLLNSEISSSSDLFLICCNNSMAVDVPSTGDGGQMQIIAEHVDLHSSDIRASSAGAGVAGRISIITSDRLTLDQSSVTTSALRSAGGQMIIRVGRLIDLQDSSIESSVGQEAGDAGDITVDPDFLILDESSILARASAGQGGDIRITADQLIVSPASQINAEAGLEGVDGTVVISTPEVNLSGGLVVLRGNFLTATPLRERCGARRDTGASSFTGVGRAGLPPSPDGPLSSAPLPLDAGGDPPRRAAFETGGSASGFRLAGAAPCPP